MVAIRSRWTDRIMVPAFVSPRTELDTEGYGESPNELA